MSVNNTSNNIMQRVCLLVLLLVTVASAASQDWSRADESRTNLQGVKPYGSAESELDELSELGEEASAQNWMESADSPDPDQPEVGQGSSIDANRVELSGADLAAAAGYHHHHHHGGHYGASGKMSMGAHSGHKGAFGWHAKFPVGGKGRR